MSPLVSLATSMQAQPGVYALLLGSGVSTGAGLLTGWGVVTELVARVAAASSNGDAAEIESARADPEGWWNANGDGPLGYSTLIETLAPTAAARQGLLAGFFEPATDDDEPTRQPSRAHKAIAELVRRGSVRVIVTTNFDRLMEQALEAVGVSPQVISRPEAINGMAPLAHSPATIIKLHGDYKDLGTRNTPTELSAYPPEWVELLEQVFDEYGLVISGWSADWDHALVAALEATASRRYPLFWDARSSRGTVAQQLLTSRRGQQVPASTADDLFGELSESVEALARLSELPLTTAMAVARLKRYLPDPVRRIDLHDLVMGAVDQVIAFIAQQPDIPEDGQQIQVEDLDRLYERYLASMDQLAQLLIVGVWHDDGTHEQLWVDVLQRLLDAGTRYPSSFSELLVSAKRIPALVALTTMTMTAAKRNRDGLIVRLGIEVDAQTRWGGDQRANAAKLLHYHYVVVDEDYVKQFPRWSGTRWRYPASHYFAETMKRYFPDMSVADFAVAYAGYEYRVGLIQGHATNYRPIAGEYHGERSWSGEQPIVEVEFRRQIARSGSTAWSDFFAARDLTLDDALVAHREVLRRLDR